MVISVIPNDRRGGFPDADAVIRLPLVFSVRLLTDGIRQAALGPRSITLIRFERLDVAYSLFFNPVLQTLFAPGAMSKLPAATPLPYVDEVVQITRLAELFGKTAYAEFIGCMDLDQHALCFRHLCALGNAWGLTRICTGHSNISLNGERSIGRGW